MIQMMSSSRCPGSIKFAIPLPVGPSQPTPPTTTRTSGGFNCSMYHQYQRQYHAHQSDPAAKSSDMTRQFVALATDQTRQIKAKKRGEIMNVHFPVPRSRRFAQPPDLNFHTLHTFTLSHPSHLFLHSPATARRRKVISCPRPRDAAITRAHPTKPHAHSDFAAYSSRCWCFYPVAPASPEKPDTKPPPQPPAAPSKP